MLAVVQDHEPVLVAQRSSQLADQIRAAARLHPHRLGQLCHHQRRIPHRCQVNEHRGASAALGVIRRTCDGETGLANARRPGEGHQPSLGIFQHPGHGRQLAVPAYQEVARRWQVSVRCLPRVSHPTAPACVPAHAAREAMPEHTNAQRLRA